jgi:hypothetical protein
MFLVKSQNTGGTFILILMPTDNVVTESKAYLDTSRATL